MNERYTPDLTAKRLCRGKPCEEYGDRCKVLSEDSCECVYAGNLIARQRVEIEELKHDLERHMAIANEAVNESEGLRGEIEQSRSLLQKVMDYHRGRGEYDFSRLPDHGDRDNASWDAWVTIREEIEDFLTTKNTCEVCSGLQTLDGEHECPVCDGTGTEKGSE